MNAARSNPFSKMSLPTRFKSKPKSKSAVSNQAIKPGRVGPHVLETKKVEVHVIRPDSVKSKKHRPATSQVRHPQERPSTKGAFSRFSSKISSWVKREANQLKNEKHNIFSSLTSPKEIESFKPLSILINGASGFVGFVGSGMGLLGAAAELTHGSLDPGHDTSNFTTGAKVIAGIGAVVKFPLTTAYLIGKGAVGLALRPVARAGEGLIKHGPVTAIIRLVTGSIASAVEAIYLVPTAICRAAEHTYSNPCI
ncbi:MAG: hypothetical protein ACI9BD_000418 [Candidatus Marinamargulisbacteria bacterium]|jgi:hypothetical protein